MKPLYYFPVVLTLSTTLALPTALVSEFLVGGTPAAIALPRVKSGVPGSRPTTARPAGEICPQHQGIQTLLFQDQQNGKTISDRPTFFWHLSNDSRVPVQFVLVDTQSGETLIDKLFPATAAKAGIMQFTLPSDKALLPGRQYLWSVVLRCNDDPSKNPLAQGYLTRVQPSADLSRQLASTSTPTTQAELLAQQGLWYDALAVVGKGDRLKAPPAHTQFLSLLQRMGHTEVVDLEQQPLPKATRSPFYQHD